MNEHVRRLAGSSPITWDVDQAKHILSSSPVRFGELDYWGNPLPQVQVNGEWLTMCRSDVKDDVCTGSGEYGSSIEDIRKNYLGMIIYGARRKHGLFAVLNALTDG